MDFINQAYTQIADVFRSMTPAARITSGLLLAVVLTSLGYLFRVQTDHADELLFGGETVTQSEMNAIDAALGKAGLNGHEFVGSRLRVPRAQKHLYWAAIVDGNAMPQSFDGAWQEMFASDSPFDPRDTRDRKAHFAEEKQLSHLVSQFSNVEIAHVTITEVEVGSFPKKIEKQALASVKAHGNRTLEDDQVKAIREMVASAAGAKRENVTVADLNGNIHPGSGGGGPSEFQNLYASYQRQYVNLYRQLISDRLSMVPGVKVTVNVELDKDIVNQTSSHKFDDKPTSLQSKTLTKEASSKPSEPGGRPGAVANAVGNSPAQVASTSATESTANETREEQNSVVGATQITTQKAPLVPIWITASIGVPTSYFKKIWIERNPTKAGEPPTEPTPEQLKQIETEQLQKLEQSVIALLPRPPKGDDPYKPVTVTSFDELSLPPETPPSLATTAGTWFAENWQTLGLFGLAAFGVVFLRGMIRSAQSVALAGPRSESDHARSASHADHDEEEEEDEDKAAATESGVHVESTAAASLKRKFASSGRSLKDELTDLVREDPDAAASVLKLWISDAA